MGNKKIQIEKTISVSIPEELQPVMEKGKGRICVVVCPDVKYVTYIEHIIILIREYMEKYNIEVKTLSQEVAPQESNFQTILGLLKDCILGIVILDGLRPNVVLEYGILLGLNKPCIVLKDGDVKIDIRNLDDNLKSKMEEHNIDNPKLDIDKHLSDVKDLHYTSYNWEDPEKFKESER